MAQNDKGKVVINEVDHSSNKDWSKVILNDEIFEEVLAKFGDEVKAKYGSYKKIGKEMICNGLCEWLRKKAYNEIPMDLPNEKGKGKVDLNEAFEDLENMIEILEDVFNRARKERMGNKDTNSKGKEVDVIIISDDDTDDDVILLDSDDSISTYDDEIYFGNWSDIDDSTSTTDDVMYVGNCSNSDSDNDVEWVPSKPTASTSRLRKVKGKASTKRVSKVKGEPSTSRVSRVKGKASTSKTVGTLILRAPKSETKKPKSEVKITNCVLGLGAPRANLGCSSSKRKKWDVPVPKKMNS